MMREDQKLSPVADAPLLCQWTAGHGRVTGASSCDGDGRASLRVDSVPEVRNAQLEVCVDPDRLPLPGDEGADSASRAAIDDLRGRCAVFAFDSFATSPATRVLIVIREMVEDGARKKSTVAAELTRVAVERGLRVIGIADLGRDDAEKLQAVFQPGGLDTVRPQIRLLADYVLFGTVQVGPGTKNEVGAWHCEATGDIALHDLHRSRILASVVLPEGEARGFAPSRFNDCAQEALRSAAGYFADHLPELVISSTEP